jgi:hypothetical protein
MVTLRGNIDGLGLDHGCDKCDSQVGVGVVDDRGLVTHDRGWDRFEGVVWLGMAYGAWGEYDWCKSPMFP